MDRFIRLLIGTDPPAEATTYNYQRRQSALVQSMSLLAAAFWIALVYFAAKESLAAGLAMAFAALYYKVHTVASMSSDAVFDSLWERTNLQSQYFDVRLRTIEAKLDVVAGRNLPLGFGSNDDDYTGELQDAYHDYPERTWARRKQEMPDGDSDDLDAD